MIDIIIKILENIKKKSVAVTMIILFVLLSLLALFITNYTTIKDFYNDVFYKGKLFDQAENLSEVSIKALLRNAQICYESGDYSGALTIYYDDILADNPIALCNAGYIYASGLGVETDLKKAEKLYMQAYAQGNETALTNLIVMKLQNYQVLTDVDSENLFFSLLTYGVDNGNIDIIRFIVSIVEGKFYSSDNHDLEYCIDFLRHSSIDELFEEGLTFYQWEIQDRKKFYSAPENNSNTKYVYISSGNENHNDTYRMYEIYEVHKLVCKFIEILNERFYPIEDNE